MTVSSVPQKASFPERLSCWSVQHSSTHQIIRGKRFPSLRGNLLPLKEAPFPTQVTTCMFSPACDGAIGNKAAYVDHRASPKANYLHRIRPAHTLEHQLHVHSSEEQISRHQPGLFSAAEEKTDI